MLCVKFKHNIISMKKIPQNTNRSNASHKFDLQNTNPFPKKEFQFIYRQKDNLPTSEAYESIIFVKSKKCENKSKSGTRKNANTHKKNSAEQLKKVLTEIEKHIKQQQKQKKGKQNEITKPTILKNTASTNFQDRSTTLDVVKEKSSHRWNKYKKPQMLSLENVKKYKNMLSPTRNLKQKTLQTSNSCKFIKTTQENFKRETKIKQKKKPTKKDNQVNSQHKLLFEEPEEYVFLENNFVELSKQEAFNLKEKLLSSRGQVFKNRQNYNRTPQSQKDCSAINENNQSIYFPEFIENEQSSRQNSVNETEQNQIFAESNLLVVQKYITNKVKIIQKWWRKMLEKMQEKENEQKAFELRSELRFNQNELKVSLAEDYQDNVLSCEKRLGTNQLCTSPIKMIEEFGNNEKFDETQVVSSRYNAAKAQMEAHVSILQKLLISKKISPEVYLDKKEMIENRYFQELQEMEQLKKIFRNNAIKTEQIEKKTLQDMRAIQSFDKEVDSTFLDKIFGFEEKQQHNNQNIEQVPAMNNDLIVSRQKSTGCHYNSDEKMQYSLYQKQNSDEQVYQEDFQEQDQYSTNNEQFQNFSAQNMQVGQSLSNNFKELLDEFKMREQAKMEIDKRAAIQMGIIFQEIPAELKDEYVGIDTSLNGIHRFLLAFFKYYIFYYKMDFLRLINMPYGFNVEKRIKFLQGYEQDCDSEQEDEDGVVYGLESVISEEIFEQFYQKVYDIGNSRISSAKLANFQFEKVHNKSLFDCFNEGLNYFRPYYLINGPPYSWNNSEKALTFYFISQENIQQVFEKTQFKVLKWASTLCGIIVNKFTSPAPPVDDGQDVQSLLEVYRQGNNPMVNETRDDRLNKNEKLEIQQNNHEWNIFQEQKTFVLIQSADFIFNFLIGELYQELYGQEKSSQLKQNEFFQHQLKTGLDFFQNLSENSSQQGAEIF